MGGPDASSVSFLRAYSSMHAGITSFNERLGVGESDASSESFLRTYSSMHAGITSFNGRLGVVAIDAFFQVLPLEKNVGKGGDADRRLFPGFTSRKNVGRRGKRLPDEEKGCQTSFSRFYL